MAGYWILNTLYVNMMRQMASVDNANWKSLHFYVHSRLPINHRTDPTGNGKKAHVETWVWVVWCFFHPALFIVLWPSTENTKHRFCAHFFQHCSSLKHRPQRKMVRAAEEQTACTQSYNNIKADYYIIFFFSCFFVLF